MRRYPLPRCSSRPRPRALVLLLALALALGGLPLPGFPGGGAALAASCVVTTVADTGAGSLRAQLADASCAAITVALPGGGPWTIALASNLPPVTRAVSVTGPGAASLTIDRNDVNSGAAFPVGGGAT